MTDLPPGNFGDTPVPVGGFDGADQEAQKNKGTMPAGKRWLSPLNQRRLRNFKKNRRALWSFWIFSVLFVLSLFAEFIANDKPVLVSCRRSLGSLQVLCRGILAAGPT